MVLENIKKAYGVRQKIQRDKQKETTLQFEMEISYTKLDVGWQFVLHRKNMFVNSGGIQTTMERMAYDLGQVIYPLIIEKTGSKNIIKSRERSLKQYDEVKQRVMESYSGDVVEKYLQYMEKTLNDPALFARSVQKKLFVSLFMESCAINRTLGEVVQRKIYLPVKKDKALATFNVSQVAEKDHTPYGTLRVTQKGEMVAGEEQQDDLLQINEGRSTGNIEIQYQWYKDTGILHSVVGRGELYSERRGKRSFSMEAYHLAERD
ncbi:hypothetical protein [Sinomicrobium weinanense]|uniref:Uncharacterized protein n=1 Tax=Sinomicrobium weinanense TaxID=2842200 RepID=A0A926JPZ2_9FLAO|nr:hypothetical protein [Sinomicrobium weinanense]MBC9795244.1 hypothetical protein [Sinomicrobium weinanense]MBU3122021.1 hypothetical protein [Sinomicrobium weinanense]